MEPSILHKNLVLSNELIRAESSPTDRKAQAFTFKLTMPIPPWQGFKKQVFRATVSILDPQRKGQTKALILVRTQDGIGSTLAR